MRFFQGILLLFPLFLAAGPPDWSPPTAGNYAFTMSITGAIRIDGSYSLDPADQVAIFKDGELRALSSGADYSSFGFTANVYYFLTAYSNESPEELEILVYHAATDAVYLSSTELTFEQQGIEGSINVPFDIDISLLTPTFPVNWGDFVARYRNGSALLRWETYGESENAGFSVERSTDGSNFAPIGFVTGQGNYRSRATYTFEDHDLTAAQRYFYRLRQIDFSGRYDYSTIVNLRVPDDSNASSWTIYPNPLRGRIGNLNRLPLSSTVQQLELRDLYGRLIWKNKIPADADTYQFELPGLPAGQYLLCLRNGNRYSTRPLVVE